MRVVVVVADLIFSLEGVEGRWRPGSGGPECGASFRGVVCGRRGAHQCVPRADRAVAFIAELLVHTKGSFARQAFRLAGWQEFGIVRPLLGEVVWSAEWGRYVRRYRLAYVVVGRKNGKSELAAALVLYLLCGDDEQGAEVYGAARDTKQAGKVFDVVARMRELSPTLAKQLVHNKQRSRITHVRSGSFYEVIASDALGELGSNPHGAVIDELLSQRDDQMFHALRTGMGTRAQPLLLLITTETNDPDSFGAGQIDEAERIAADPRSAPHVFTFVRKLPVDADPWDERNWAWPNPALGSFLSIETLREEAADAKANPAYENSFRQFRLNQRVQQRSRWMPTHVWDGCGRELLEPMMCALAGARCVAGLDLAATTDLASWCLVFPGADDVWRVLWRVWCPEAQVRRLSDSTGGRFGVWCRDGLVTVTPGDWIDYGAIRAGIAEDLERFVVADVGYDPWGATETVQWLQDGGVTVTPVRQTYEGLSHAMGEVLRRVHAGTFEHAGNPVARWCADGVEVQSPAGQPDVVKPVKPKRNASGVRIDAFVALTIAAARAMVEQPADVVSSVW